MNATWLLRSGTVWGALGLSALLSAGVLWLSSEGLSALRQREQEVHQAQSKLLALERRNLELFDEVKRLARKDPELMEGLARRRGLARPGETIYTFKDRTEGR